MVKFKSKARSIMESGPYNILICILAILSVILAVVDLTAGLSFQASVMDTTIYWIFVTDYLAGIWIAADKWNFLKSNVWDLIAIIPFNSAFRVFRTFRAIRLLKLAKLVKLARIGSVIARLLEKCRRFLDTNGFKYVLILSGVSIIMASVLMTYFEGMPFEDALWWSFVTATTVGYGDLSPSTTAGRVIAAMLMLVGIGLIGSLTSSITTYFIDKSSQENHSSDKVMMVKTMYDSLSESEKTEFRRLL